MSAPPRPPGFEALRMFLRKTEPAHIVCHTELGDRTIDCKSGLWRELGDTIVAMKPHGIIEAFSDKNLLLKTFDAQRLGFDDRESETPVVVSSAQSDMALYQRLLAEAYRHSNEREERRWETAFGAVTRLCEIAFKRLETIEASWARLHRSRTAELERAEERAEEDTPGFDQQILGALASGVMNGIHSGPGGGPSPQAPAPGKNGKRG